MLHGDEPLNGRLTGIGGVKTVVGMTESVRVGRCSLQPNLMLVSCYQSNINWQYLQCNIPEVGE